MEPLKSGVIFSQKFPDSYPMAILERMEGLGSGVPAEKKAPPFSFEELLKRIEESNTYEPRPDAAKKSEAFVACAIDVCRDFEIDTEITKGNYGINVTMDLDYGWYGGEVKRLLTAVMRLADEFTLACNESRPECIRVSMTYHTHDRYVHGKRADW